MDTAPPKSVPPKRKLRWYQFSLRSLLIAVTLAGLLCACCVPLVRAWQQPQSERDFEELIDFMERTGISQPWQTNK